MKRKLILLGIALLGSAAALCIQPRPAAASNCFCDDAACCNWCCVLASGKIFCSERPCIDQ